MPPQRPSAMALASASQGSLLVLVPCVQKPFGHRPKPKAARSRWEMPRRFLTCRTLLPSWIKRRPVQRRMGSGPHRMVARSVSVVKASTAASNGAAPAHQSQGLFDVDFKPRTLFGRIVRWSPQGGARVQRILPAAAPPDKRTAAVPKTVFTMSNNPGDEPVASLPMWRPWSRPSRLRGTDPRSLREAFAQTLPQMAGKMPSEQFVEFATLFRMPPHGL